MDDDFPPVHCLEPVCQPPAIHVGPAPAAFSTQLLNNDIACLPSIPCLPSSLVTFVAAAFSTQLLDNDIMCLPSIRCLASSLVNFVAADSGCHTCQPAMHQGQNWTLFVLG